MDVRVPQPRLAPGVEGRDDPRSSPQVCAIGQELTQGRMHAGTQQRRHHVDMGQPQRMELMGHGADGMGVVTGQQTGLLLDEPALDLEPGAWRAHPVPTRMVPNPFEMPLWTRVDVSTQERGATGEHRPYGSTHMRGQGMTALIRRIAQLQDRLKRECICAQRLSFTAQASLQHCRLAHNLPRICGSVQRPRLQRRVGEPPLTCSLADDCRATTAPTRPPGSRG